jgi:HSP20 family protein
MKIARCTPAFQFGRTSDIGPWLRHPLAGLPAMAQLFEDFLPANNSSNLVTDLYEDTDHFRARFELPGVKKDAVKIELHERVLTVTAERLVKAGEKESARTLSRSLALPEIVQEDGITAKLEDGILSVTLPKQESRKPKVISVN